MKIFDVAIAGGGLIGASIAFELARAGLRVGLFDKQEPEKKRLGRVRAFCRRRRKAPP